VTSAQSEHSRIVGWMPISFTGQGPINADQRLTGREAQMRWLYLSQVAIPYELVTSFEAFV
jgi:hypothetical protein